MARLHDNTTFDPEAEAVSFVTKLEQEALDEDQVIGAISAAVRVLESRRQAASDSIKADLSSRIVDARRARLKSGVKGVKPIEFAPAEGLVKPVGLIPSRAH